jgi:N-acetylmuramoyl-L-alanine amidase
VVRHLKSKRWSRIKDKGVKQAPFYVLLGAQMPAVLVETGFISNPRECKRLITPKYQERLCEAILKGIRTYIRETSPTAFMTEPPKAGTSG